MIKVKNVKVYCCEDISLIENYEKAIADKTKTWHCHHRKETDEGLSADELIEMGLYFNRPASELIFMTESEHHSLHSKGNKHSLGKHFTDEQKEKLSKSSPNKKPVYQIDKTTGEIIKEWEGMNIAAKALAVNHSGIFKCCRGRLKSSGGFIWRYVDEC